MINKKLLWALAILGLVLTILPSILTFSGIISFQQHKWLMTIGTILWLGTAPFVMQKSSEEA
jgi:hypothetical protein